MIRIKGIQKVSIDMHDEGYASGSFYFPLKYDVQCYETYDLQYNNYRYMLWILAQLLIARLRNRGHHMIIIM